MNDPATSPTQLPTLPSDSPAEPTGRSGPIDPADPYIGALVQERYRILERVGEGGMGAVYRAEHVLMKKTVALKLLHPDLGRQEDAARRFEREAQSASRLNHPHIVAVTDFGRAASGELFLVMELVVGRSLAQLIEAQPQRRVPVARAVAITRQILRALEHAHRQGIVHRDLKPANVMLAAAEGDGEETVKILDFGIAKIVAGEGEVQLTQGAMVFGTPSYMSPEQATAGEVDARSDLYSCGVMLYEMIAGRKAFVAEDAVKVMAMQVTATPPSFAQTAPDVRVPAALVAAVMRALEKSRDRRFPSAAAFQEALAQVPLSPTDAEAGVAANLMAGVKAGALRARPLVSELSVRYARLPWTVRRWAPLVGVVGVVAALVLVPTWLFRSGATPSSAPPPPKAVEPAVMEPLRLIDEALGKGNLPAARMMIMQQLSQHPGEARIHHRLGMLEHVEGRRGASLTAYAEALRLDPGLRGDPAVLMAARSFLEDKRWGRDALGLMIGLVGKPACETLAEVASSDRRLEFRQEARHGAKQVGCSDKVDLVSSYTLDLQQAKTCDDKRAAVNGLAETKDRRAIEPLKSMRRGGGPFGWFGGGNACIRKDIEAALKQLDD